MEVKDQKVIACAEELQDECDAFVKELMDKKTGGSQDSAVSVWFLLALARVMVAQEELAERLEDVKIKLPKRF